MTTCENGTNIALITRDVGHIEQLHQHGIKFVEESAIRGAALSQNNVSSIDLTERKRLHALFHGCAWMRMLVVMCVQLGFWRCEGWCGLGEKNERHVRVHVQPQVGCHSVTKSNDQTTTILTILTWP